MTNLPGLDAWLDGQANADNVELSKDQEYYINEAEECGLCYAGLTGFGQPEFIGTTKEFQAFEDKLLINPFYDYE